MSDYVDNLSFSDTVLQQPYIEQIRLDNKVLGSGISKRAAYVDTCLIISPSAYKFLQPYNNQYEYLKLSVIKIVKNSTTLEYVNALVNGLLPNPFPRGTREKYGEYIEYKEIPFSEILPTTTPRDSGLARFGKYKKAVIFDLSEDDMHGLHFATFITMKDNAESLDKQTSDGPPVIGPIRLYQATDDSGGFVNESNILLTADNKIWAGSYHSMSNQDGTRTYMKGLVHNNQLNVSTETLSLSKLNSIPFVIEMDSLFGKNSRSLNKNTFATKIVYNPFYITTTLQRSNSETPGELALFFDDNKDASERILEEQLILRNQGKISSVSNGLFTEGRSFPLITKPSSRTPSLQKMSEQIDNLSNRQSITTLSSETIKRETSSFLTSVSEMSQPISVKTINNNRLNPKNTGRNFRLKKAQKIKPVSDIYTSVNEKNEVFVGFVADKINILKILSQYQSIIDELEESELEKALNLTYLKSLSVSRVANLIGTKVSETVFDKQLNRELNSPGLENPVYYNRLFKTGESVKVATLRVEKNLFDQNRMTFYSLTDHRKDTSIKDQYEYEIEFEFEDGIRGLINDKLSILDKNIRIIKNIYDFCVANNLFYGKFGPNQSLLTGYNLQAINKKSKRAMQNLAKSPNKIPSNLQNSNFLDGRIKTAIASYVDLVGLFVPKQFREPKRAFEVLHEKTGFLSGTREGLEEFIKSCEILAKHIRQSETSEMSYENSVYFRKKMFSRGKNTKQYLKFKTKSKKIKVITEDRNGLNYMPNLSEEQSPYTDILFNSFSNLINFTEDPLIEPKFLMASSGKVNLTLKNAISNYTLMNNQRNMVSNLGIRQDYNSVESEESQSELMEKDRVLDFLSSNGIYIKEFKPEGAPKEVREVKSKLETKDTNSLVNPSLLVKASDIIKASPAFTDNYTPNVTKIEPGSQDYVKSKNLDFDLDLAHIAASISVDSGTNKRIRKNIQSFDVAGYVLANCFNVRTQYLTGFKMRGNVNLFDEEWVSLDLSTETPFNTKNMFCRLLEVNKNRASIDARNELNAITLDSHFFLRPSTVKQGVAIPLQDRNLTKNDGKSLINSDPTMDLGDLQTFSRSTSELFTGIQRSPETLDLFTIQDLERIFNLSIPIKQPNNVTIFGTNFNPAPSKIVRGTKGALDKSSAQIVSSLFNSAGTTQVGPANLVKSSTQQISNIPTKFNYSGE